MLQVRSFSAMFMVFATAPLGLVGAVPDAARVPAALRLQRHPRPDRAVRHPDAQHADSRRPDRSQEREAGRSDYDAIVESTVRRARPVILTALAAHARFHPAHPFGVLGNAGVHVDWWNLRRNDPHPGVLDGVYAIWFKIKPAASERNAVSSIQAEPVPGQEVSSSRR